MLNWTPPSGTEGLLLLLHGPDRRNYDDSTRRVFFRRVAEAVRRREGRRSHQRTVIAGDFNADPFESAVSSSDGLHAVGTRTVGAANVRRIAHAGNAQQFFYNPMWRLYGHRRHQDSGAATHHWTQSWAHGLSWHMLDQVVLRPSESPNFPEDRLRIVLALAPSPCSTEKGCRTGQRRQTICRLSSTGTCNSKTRSSIMPDLWPDFAGLAAKRGMFEMLLAAAGGIGAKTEGEVDFHIDAVGVGPVGGPVQRIRYNCYLRVVKTGYLYLLFRVITPVAAAFPARAETPEGDEYAEIGDEHALIEVISKILQRERTREIVLYLLSIVPKATAK